MSFSYETKSDEPGELFTDTEVEDETFFGTRKRQVEAQTSLVYTDYDNIALFYTCLETRKYWMPQAHASFSIAVRKRTFDSLSLFGNAAGALKKLGVSLNDIDFVYNGDSCKN